jgi:hypothetical protein
MPSDLDAWLAERKSKWPTKARREAREAELAKRREAAREQSLRDKAKAAREREERRANEAKAAKAKKDHDDESKLEKQQRKAEKLRKQLEKAERKLQESIKAGEKRKRSIDDEGDEGEGNDKKGDDVDQLIANATAKATAGAANESESSNSSDSLSNSDSDDSAPDAQSSRRSGPTKVLPPARAQLQIPCKYFSTGGSCGKKGKCRFVHDQTVRDAAIKERAKGGRMSLAERLQQNEIEKEELMVLKAIKYAAEHGLLDDPNSVPESKQIDDPEPEKEEGGQDVQTDETMAEGEPQQKVEAETMIKVEDAGEEQPPAIKSEQFSSPVKTDSI